MSWSPTVEVRCFPVVSKHLLTVTRIVEYLTRHGIRGRADHIGPHRFQRKRLGLFVGRFRPDILLQESSMKLVVEVVCPPVMRGGRLVDALSHYRGTDTLCIVVAPSCELQTLQDALTLMDLHPYLVTDSLDRCTKSIHTLIKGVTKTAQSRLD